MAQDEGGHPYHPELPPRTLAPEDQDIQAEVTLLRTEDGGLREYARSVYFRPQVWYDGSTGMRSWISARPTGLCPAKQ
jgi:hypothetical protein